MKILPIDIRQKSFAKKTFGGFKTEEVQSFLSELSEEWLALTLQHKELERKNQFLQEELDKVRALEGQLMQQCQHTEQLSKEIVQRSQKEARVNLMRAEVEAKAIIDVAKQKAYAMLNKVKGDCDLRIKNVKTEFDLLSDSFQEVESFTGELMDELKDFVEATNQKIAKISSMKTQKVAEEKLMAAQKLLQATLRSTNAEIDKMMESNVLHEDAKQMAAGTITQATHVTKTIEQISEATEAEVVTTEPEKKDVSSMPLHERLAQQVNRGGKKQRRATA